MKLTVEELEYLSQTIASLNT